MMYSFDTDVSGFLKKDTNPYPQKILEYQEAYFPRTGAGKGVQKALDFYFQKTLPKPTILEIGCHYGRTLSCLARENPDDYFIGLDITFKRVVKTFENLLREDIPNASVFLLHAQKLHQILPPASLAGICIFFPDPWPKKKHQKNRLLSEHHLKELSALLRPGGFIWLKTDQASYYDFAQQNALALGFRHGDPMTIPHLPTLTEPTVFEKLFTQRGDTVHQAFFVRD